MSESVRTRKFVHDVFASVECMCFGISRGRSNRSFERHFVRTRNEMARALVRRKRPIARRRILEGSVEVFERVETVYRTVVGVGRDIERFDGIAMAVVQGAASS